MNTTPTRRAGWLTAMIALLLGALIVGGSAQPVPAAVGTPVSPQQLPPQLTAAAAAESASLAAGQTKRRAHFEFRKNQKDPTKSRLLLYGAVYAQNDAPRYVKLGSWRAGSGIGGTGVGQNPCASDQGWLPNGRYDGYSKDSTGIHHTNFNGGLIFGIVWHLQNKRCGGDSTVRTELFIHSEMRPDRKQACHSGYQENQCWDGPADHTSAGCIKLKPKDIAAAARLARSWGGPQPGQTHYSNLLLVTS